MTSVIAALEMRDIIVHWRALTPGTRDRFVILSALAFVTMLIVCWAAFFLRRESRSRSLRHSQHYSREDSSNSSGDGEQGSAEAAPPGRKRRRQRRPHRPLNPTLAQTGGLPPSRTEDPRRPPR